LETVVVEGMTCSHCETSVQNNLLKIKGITNVVADNRAGSVQISGTNINLKEISKIVNGLGYKFKGRKDL